MEDRIYIARMEEGKSLKFRVAEDGERLEPFRDLFYLKGCERSKVEGMGKSEIEKLILATRSSDDLPRDLYRWRYSNREKMERVNGKLEERLDGEGEVVVMKIRADDGENNYVITIERERVIYGEELMKLYIVDREKLKRGLREEAKPLYVYEDETFEWFEDGSRSSICISCDERSKIFEYYDRVIEKSIL